MFKVLLIKQRPLLLKSADSAAIIWKQLCSKVAGDYVAEIVLTHQNGRFLVDHALLSGPEYILYLQNNQTLHTKDNLPNQGAKNLAIAPGNKKKN